MEVIRASLDKSTKYTSLIKSKPLISKAEHCERENHLLWFNLQVAAAHIGIAQFTVNKLSGEALKKEARKPTRQWRRESRSIERHRRQIESRTADIVAHGADARCIKGKAKVSVNRTNRELSHP
jgi:hypothetical protein